MAGASDKARFYLEQAVPQLQEFKEKKIFDDVSYLLKITERSRRSVENKDC
jgi:U3 small nucleolar RNA-associated protein 6